MEAERMSDSRLIAAECWCLLIAIVSMLDHIHPHGRPGAQRSRRDGGTGLEAGALITLHLVDL
jgi:hypothetical protein